MHRISQLLVVSLFVVIFLAPSAVSCGCGLAISESKVFNALKETQAYLLIDIKDETSFDELPFFRMVSMEEPYNVTIVFPIDGIPYSVEGKQITAEQFLNDYKIRSAESYIERQSFSGVLKKVGKEMKESSSVVFYFANGFAGISYMFASQKAGAMDNLGAQTQGIDSLAHFEFEGGSLDIYDVNSMDTLEAFVKQINITLDKKAEELVTKYKDDYVAVLRLKVPSALDERSRGLLSACPAQTEALKQSLKEKTEFTQEEIYTLTNGQCGEQLRELIYSVTGFNQNVNGTLVAMKFKDTNKFFYPTSIVNSYNYPITDQKYFIKTPSSLDIDLESSAIGKKAVFDSERWYKVTSTKEDLKGRIVKAGIIVKTGDFFRRLVLVFYGFSGLIVLAAYLLIITLPLVYYSKKVEEPISSGEKWLAIILLFLIGFLLTSVIMLIKKKKKLALALSLVWSVLLGIKLAYGLF